MAWRATATGADGQTLGPIDFDEEGSLAWDFPSPAAIRHISVERIKDCPSCQGSGETPVEDRWSYGDGRGRGEGHYTVGGGPCPCCKGECVVPYYSAHDASDDCGQPSEPPEPEAEPEDLAIGDPPGHYEDPGDPPEPEPDYAKDYPEED